MTEPVSLSYRDAGVDIDSGNALVERIKPACARTLRPGVLGGLGGFGALFELPLDRYRQPVLVSGTDGVGTKLKLAMQMEKHHTIGIDLVAMCVNDVLVQGAEPLFFLDYYATGKLDVEIAAQVITGIAKGCELAGAALVGGETAEMPGMYAGGDYDLAGFCVGIVEKSKILTGQQVRPGDVLLGLASSGPHSNGYSLIRKLLAVSGADLSAPFPSAPLRAGDSAPFDSAPFDSAPFDSAQGAGRSLGETLLEPTRIYVKSLLGLLQQVPVHALAHITGGGLSENIPRVLPEGCCARIRLSAWPRPPVFRWLQEKGRIAEDEMLRTFNCGIGMVICLPAEDQARATEILQAAGETVYPIGEIVAHASQRISFS